MLNTSQPVALPWVDKVKAVLEMWWPGDEGGWSTANILLGKTSPAGRLPITWGKSLDDYPATDPKHPERSWKGVDGKTTYSEGVNVGYRWFDKENIAPLFPFGHGLSYTTFDYSDLDVAQASADGGLEVNVTIKNTGNMDSDEVPQVYLGAPDDIPAGVQFPVRALVGFDRIHLEAGEIKTRHPPRSPAPVAVLVYCGNQVGHRQRQAQSQRRRILPRPPPPPNHHRIINPHPKHQRRSPQGSGVFLIPDP